MRPIDTDGVAW